MTASIYAKANGTQGALQVNGVDSLVFDSTGLVSGDTNTLNKTLGYGQTWQNVTGSRAAGTTYYNTTGKPKSATARVQAISAAAAANFSANGVANVGYIEVNTAIGLMANVYLPVIPPGAPYALSLSGMVLVQWFELE